MEHGLACILTDIDAYVITIRMETFVYFLLHILQHNIHCFALMIGKVKIR